MKLDWSRAWSDAMALLKHHTDILLTLAGVFFLLPPLLLYTLAPFRPADTAVFDVKQYIAYVDAHAGYMLLIALAAALGRVTILVLLLDPARPTVGQALARGVRLLPVFVVMDLLIGLMLLAGWFLLIVPALYIYGRTLLAETVLVRERPRGPIEQIRRAFSLTRGNGWRCVGIAAIIYVAGLIVSAAIGSVVGVAAALAGDPSLAAFVDALVDTLFAAAIGLLMLLIAIAIYRQLGPE